MANEVRHTRFEGAGHGTQPASVDARVEPLDNPQRQRARHAAADQFATRRRSRNRIYSMRAVFAVIVVIATSLALMVSALSATWDVATQDAGFYHTETAGVALTDDPTSDNGAKTSDDKGSPDSASASAADASDGEGDDRDSNGDGRAIVTTDDDKASASSAAADPANMPAQTFNDSLKDEDGNVTLTVSVSAPEGAFPNNTTMKLSSVADKTVRDQVEAAIKADDSVKGEVKSMTAVDIAFFDEAGNEIEPAKKVEVKITSSEIRNIDNPVLVHVPDKQKADEKAKAEGAEPKEAEVVKKVDLVSQNEARSDKGAEDTLKFDTDTFSPYVIVELEEISTQVITADGKTYAITVTYGPDAGVPEGAQLAVEELSGDAYDDYVGRTADALGWDAASLSYARLFDIKIVHDGQKVEIAAPVSVNIQLADKDAGAEAAANTKVVHFADGVQDGDVVRDVDVDGDAVSFEAEGFSAYAIVEGPSSTPIGWTKLTSMADLETYMAGGIYIGHTGGMYLTATEDVASNNAHGVQKTKPAQAFPPSAAVKYYFEAVEGTTNQFYLYCLKDGEKYYIENGPNEHLYLTTDEASKTAFEVVAEKNNQFSVKSTATNRYLNNWQDNNGKVFAFWTEKNGGSLLNFWYHDDSATGDPYGLDGKTYGLMNWEGGTTGRAMMANSSTANRLDALALTVMAKKQDNKDKLFVPDDSGISTWTFTWIDSDRYYLTSQVGGATQYLKVTSSGLSLVSSPDESCKLQVVPGTGTRAGEICLKSGSTTLTYSGKVETGFGVKGATGSEWLKLVEESELTSDYFMKYSAQKVGVSDEEHVTQGSRVIVYTRVWNDTAKKYEFYAVDHDGSLVRCYESGDFVEWVGPHLNTLQWNFVEYYWEGTTSPNFYYELYNQYSKKYIAPQVSDGQILSDDTIGINLDGRKNGQYYTTVLAWDDENYSYVGLKADLATGKVVSCPKSEADDFYFAIMQDNSVDDELTTVPTVDHVQHGITMKIVDFKDRKTMSDFLGNDAYTNGNTTPNLLSTNLVDGYPAAKGGSLSSWFSEAQEVNHLFIESTYSGTGYYEYDSTQNFAHLNTSGDNAYDFTVYKELGTMDGSGNSKFYKHGQFMPYNDLQAGVFASVNSENTTAATGVDLPDSDPRKYERLYLVKNPNYYNGVELEASFTQTPDGLDDWGHDIIYEFTGDDDFWLYVDGELVIDLGGIHDALPGSVNYRTGEAVVNGKKTTLKDLFYNNYKGRGHTDAEAQAYVDGIFEQNEDGQYVFKDYTTHTMKIFYLERGAGASNLHMRFNLASVKPGTVQLTKKLSGTESAETILAEYPYQIWYMTESGDVRRLANTAVGTSDQGVEYVFYKNSTNPVTYKPTLDIGGVRYDDVFMLKPDETAEINFPEGVKEYKIVECGVDTSVYSLVSANGDVLEGVSPGEGAAENRKDFGLEYATTDARARVTYTNAVKPEALRVLTAVKKLFKEDGVTQIVYPADKTTFNFRLYLATEFDGDVASAPADKHTYHVKDPEGNYCKWVVGEGFESIGVMEYASLTAEQKKQVMFTTSSNGSISRIPVGYTVEVRDVLAGTSFLLVERPTEMPDGYSFQKYVYGDKEYKSDAEHSYDDVAWAGVGGTVEAGSDPHVDVCNLKGWGLRVNKVWSDAVYMTNRDPVYFAVFTRAGDSEVGEGESGDAAGDEAASGDENLTLVTGTVHQMAYGTTTSYWYFLPLPVNVPFNDYEIREVTISNANPTVGEDGVVSDPGEVTLIADGGPATLSGTQKGETSAADYTYTVSYEKGTVSEGSNVRVDTTTNSRPGVELRKTQWDGETPLAGAVFTLAEKESGSVLGTFTSGSDGLITVAFLGKNKDYTLTETKAPRTQDARYRGLASPLTICVDADGNVSVRGSNEDYYTLVQEQGATPTLTIKNRPFTFRAFKKNAETGEAVPSVKFALHMQHTVDGRTDFDTNPMEGYQELVTDAYGAIPGIDETLAPGTYQLRETAALEGYETLPAHTVFTVGETGEIALGSHPDGVTLVDGSAQGASGADADLGDSSSGDAVSYVMTIPNSQNKPVSIWKTDVAGQTIATGADFALYKSEDFDAAAGAPRSGVVAVMTGTTGENGLLQLGSLGLGTYYLVETKAPAGYNATSPVTITVEATQVSAKQGGNDSEVAHKGSSHEDYIVSGQSDSVWQVRVWNSAGLELPNTGGPGTWPFVVLGLLALGAGLALLRPARSR